MNAVGFNLQEVLEVIGRAVSQVPEAVKGAEKTVKEWETRPGYFATLQQIFSDSSIDLHRRWMAVLLFKNGIDRYWRKTAPNAIREDEKGLIREKLLYSFGEEVNQIATQLAVLIARIARYDCPKYWPQLLPSLIGKIKSENPLERERSLVVLQYVVKTLAFKRLAADKVVFRQIADELLQHVVIVYNIYLKAFLEPLVGVKASGVGKLSDEQSHELKTSHLKNVELCRTCLKIIRPILIYGYVDFAQSESAMSFLKELLECMTQSVQLRLLIPADSDFGDKFDRTIIKMAKCIVETQYSNPIAYSELNEPTLRFFVNCIGQAHEEAEQHGRPVLDRLLIQSLLFVKHVANFKSYKAKEGDALSEMKCKAAIEVVKSVLAPTVIVQMNTLLIRRYFVMTENDLVSWENNPEDFVFEESGDSWRYNLHSCATNVYLSFFNDCRELIAPIVLELLESVQNVDGGYDLPSILLKDAVYNAVARGAYDLYDNLDFTAYFHSVLQKDVQDMRPQYKIIRRRAALLIGAWIGVKLNDRKGAYRVLVTLLTGTEDLVVRLSAAVALKQAVDDFGFHPHDFQEYLPAAFTSLFQLLCEAEECDSKMQVLSVLSVIIERVDKDMRPFVASFCSYLPQLWVQAQEHNLLKSAIVTTSIYLVKALGEYSSNIHDFLLNVIQTSTDLNNESHVYLMEDGLELWLAVMKATPSCSQHMIQVLPNVFPVLDVASENLKICVNIIESYLLLSPNEVMQSISAILASVICSLQKNLRPEGQVILSKLVDLIFRAFPEQGPSLLENYLASILFLVLKGEEFNTVMNAYLSLFCRIFVQNRKFALELFEKANASPLNAQQLNVFAEFVKILLVNLPSRKLGTNDKDHNNGLMYLSGLSTLTGSTKNNMIAQPEKRKLVALALCGFLELGGPVVETHFNDILAIIVDVMTEIHKLNGPEGGYDYLVRQGGVGHEEDDENLEDVRKRELSLLDPVYSATLRDYFYASLGKSEQIYGATFRGLIAKVSEETIKDLNRYSPTKSSNVH
eukprot:Nk52_evm2s229 gene=Nk52_evmTU2s229